MPEPRVAVVAYDVSRRGGEERVLLETIRRTQKRIRWVVVSARLDPELRPLVEWRRVPAPGPFRARLASLLAFGGARVAAAGADLVHVSGPLLLNRVDVASVQFLRAAFYEAIGAEQSAATRAHLALERLALGRARVLLAPSPFVERELSRRFPGKAIAVVPNGVDLERFRPDEADRAAVRAELNVPAGRLVALFAGHGWTRKGLVPAIDGLARSSADAELWVVGEGDPARYGGGERIRYLGPRGDLDRLFRGADVFVLPSSFETFGIVLAEAAASGVPVIATRTGIAEDLGDAAILVERDPEEIAAALTTLATDPARRAAMGGEGRRRAAAYTWDTSVAALLEVYDGLLARKR
jgi:glycosyltransferase involved in cell wall biosynthesis